MIGAKDKVLKGYDRLSFGTSAATGVVEKQKFVDGLVSGGKWGELAYILSDPNLRDIYKDEISNIAALLPVGFQEILEEEAIHIATLEFDKELGKLKQVEDIARGKLEEAVQEREAVMNSADELVKVGFEANPKIKELEDQIANKIDAKNVVINRIKKRNKHLSDKYFEDLDANVEAASAKVEKTKVEIAEENNKMSNVIFGVDKAKVEKLQSRLKNEEKSLSNLKKVQEKLQPITSEINNLTGERNELAKEDEAKLAEIKARAEQMRKDATLQLGGAIESANLKFIAASEERRHFEDGKGKYMSDRYESITEGSMKPLEDIKISLGYLYMNNKLKEVATYLFEGAGRGHMEFSAPVLKAMINDGRQDDMINVVSQLSDEARLSFVNGLIEIGELGGLKDKMDKLKIAPDKQIEVGRRLLDGKEYQLAYTIMGMEASIKYLYEGAGKGLSFEFVNSMGNYERRLRKVRDKLLNDKATPDQIIAEVDKLGNKARLDQIIAEVAKLGDKATSGQIIAAIDKLADEAGLDRIIAEVAKLGDEAKDLLINDLIKGGLQDLKGIMDELGMSEAKQQGVAYGLLDSKDFARAYYIMGIGGLVGYLYADESRKELSSEFMKFAAKTKKLDDMTKVVAGLGEAAKSTFIDQLIANNLVVGMKLRLDVLGIAPDKQISIAKARIDLGDYRAAYYIMNGNGQLEEFNKAAKDRVAKLPAPAYELRAYAAGFPNQKMGSEYAGRLLAESIMGTLNEPRKRLVIEDEVGKKIRLLEGIKEDINRGDTDNRLGFKTVKEVDDAIAIAKAGTSASSKTNEDVLRDFINENPILKDIDAKETLSTNDKINLAGILTDALRELDKQEDLDPRVKNLLTMQLNGIYQRKCLVEQPQGSKHSLPVILEEYSKKDIYNALKVATHEKYQEREAAGRGVSREPDPAESILYARNLQTFGKARDALNDVMAKQGLDKELSVGDQLRAFFSAILAAFDIKYQPDPEALMDVAAHIVGLKGRLDPETRGQVDEASLANAKAAVGVGKTGGVVR